MQNNNLDGIIASDADSVIRYKLIDDHSGGSAILVGGNECRVEGRHCGDATFGIRVTSTRSPIVRNSRAENTTNYSIVAGDSLGQIVRAAANGSAVNGSSAAAALGTTDPGGNISQREKSTAISDSIVNQDDPSMARRA